MFKKIAKLIRCDMAIDLGTANTLIFLSNKGIVMSEPSVVAVQQTSTGQPKVVAVGHKAKNMLGRTPGNIQAIRPVKDGVIANFDITAEMLRYFIKRIQKETSFFKLKPRLIIGIPAGITQVEKRAVREAAEFAGSGEVFLIDESMAASIGSGLPISEPNGNMIIDIGGGTTEIAVISMGGVVYSHSSKIGHWRYRNGMKPIDAAIDSSIRKTSPEPANSAASLTALFSTCVIPAGIPMMSLGLSLKKEVSFWIRLIK